MKTVDVFFGKKITGSSYHINTMYLHRFGMEDEIELPGILSNAIDGILSQEGLDDDVSILLGNLKSEIVNPDGIVPRKVNDITGSLVYLGYVIYAVVRTDIDSEVELDASSARFYAMNKQISEQNLFNVNIFQWGLCNVIDSDSMVNQNAMVMEFLIDNVINIDDECYSIINLKEVIEEYNAMDKYNESSNMDTTDVLKMLEDLNYKFFILLPAADFGLEG
jgi:hypothetical protein